MIRYILKRLLMLIPVMIGVSLFIFIIMDFAPGDAAMTALGDNATEQQLFEYRQERGLNDPVFVRYARYMLGIVRGDLGTSYITNRNVLQTYLQKLPYTLELAFSGTLLAVFFSIILGVIAALRRGTIIDSSVMILALIGLSMPLFWLGLLLIICFSLNLGLLPPGGAEGIEYLVLPAVTLAVAKMALLTRTTRSSMLEVINEDYIRTARAKGVSKKDAVRKHALRNALIPIITAIGIELGSSLGGSVIVETVFAWPGVGRLIVDSIGKRDTPMVTGCLILTTMIVAMLLLIVDIIYAYVDPRIKGQYSK
ncbi:MAG: Glutathione transport system permease protein GsiC [Firmicutes bacterium ADurb.Bin182]|nr:MAG: Glutathione transport system permease protein GsiC [Firmicutes bacterium ADurb.Bin182]